MSQLRFKRNNYISDSDIECETSYGDVSMQSSNDDSINNVSMSSPIVPSARRVALSVFDTSTEDSSNGEVSYEKKNTTRDNSLTSSGGEIEHGSLKEDSVIEESISSENNEDPSQINAATEEVNMSVVNESSQLINDMSIIISDDDEIQEISGIGVKHLPVPKELIENNEKVATVAMKPVPKYLVEDSQNSQILAEDSGGDSDVIVEDSYGETNKTKISHSSDSNAHEFSKNLSASDASNSSKNSQKTVISSGEQASWSSTEDRSYGHDDEGESEDEVKVLRISGNNNKREEQIKTLQKEIMDKKTVYNKFMAAFRSCNISKFKDGGKQLKDEMSRVQLELETLRAKLRDLDGEEAYVTDSTTKTEAIFSATDQKTDHLGKKGMEAYRVESALTMDSLVTFYNSLRTCPSSDEMAEPPLGLKSTLMPHQLKALLWLLHRERQRPSGGILADDMGLGKTLTMIALVLKAAELDKNDEQQEITYGKRDGEHPGKTLVVGPASLIGQWESQVKEHTKRGILTTLVHHGNYREVRGRELSRYDIVITTYGVLTQENKGDRQGALFRVFWERVILDEAHTIRNHKTLSSKAACDLKAKHRWCLTGTPVHNKELDMYALLKFLRCSPFDDLAVWKRWVVNKSVAGTDRLNTIVRAIMLRRTKAELMEAGFLKEMPSKEMHRVEIVLDDQERIVYMHVMNFSKTLLAQYLKQRQDREGTSLTYVQHQLAQHQGDIKTHEILVLLLRLRQICCLPGLIQKMLEEDSCATDGIDTTADSALEALSKQVNRLSISKPQIEETEHSHVEQLQKVLLNSNPVFDEKRPSSKIRTLIKVLRDILATDDKIVVVSQWSSYLRILEGHLRKIGVSCAILDGSIAVKDRPQIIESFNKPTGQTRILLLSLTAGGVGLNLVGGNRLFLMEPHWNPQLEAQACDRVYRVGQTKPVHIYKVVCRDTIEERIENLQLKKLELADSVLSGQAKKELSKLTLQDIKSLFDL